jgi:hypothetical protein
MSFVDVLHLDMLPDERLTCQYRCFCALGVKYCPTDSARSSEAAPTRLPVKSYAVCGGSRRSTKFQLSIQSYPFRQRVCDNAAANLQMSIIKANRDGVFIDAKFASWNGH